MGHPADPGILLMFLKQTVVVILQELWVGDKPIGQNDSATFVIIEETRYEVVIRYTISKMPGNHDAIIRSDRQQARIKGSIVYRIQAKSISRICSVS